MPSISLIPGAISQLISTAYNTRRLTKADRYVIMAAILNESITEEERCSLDHLLLSAVKGHIQVTDELSIA